MLKDLPSSVGSLSLEKIENAFNYLPLEEIHLGFSTKQQWKKSYSQLLNLEEQNLKELHKEFIDFRAIDQATVCNYKDGSKENRMDAIWYHLQLLKSPVGNNSRFKRLSKVARIVLLATYSNVGVKREYSFVNKNKHKDSERNQLEIDGSLSSILAVKLDTSERKQKCFMFQPSKQLLHNDKKATVKYNAKHSK